MKYKAKTVLVLADTVAEVQHAILQYGPDMALTTTVIPVTSYAVAQSCIATYPANTDWCIASSRYDIHAWKALQSFFGVAKLQSEAFDVETDEVAINPRLLRG